jgi:predicted O-methyltransferase YrrM
MNDVLKGILQSNRVTDGTESLPLHSAMSEEEGEVISKVFTAVKPDVSLEVGFAYGISTLYVCDALAQNRKDSKHIIIDPEQTTSWRGIGIKNIARAGYRHLIDLHEERSEIALPIFFPKEQGYRSRSSMDGTPLIMPLLIFSTSIRCWMSEAL